MATPFAIPPSLNLILETLSSTNHYPSCSHIVSEIFFERTLKKKTFTLQIIIKNKLLIGIFHFFSFNVLK
jgi:hypothetical protein